ncbi:AMP-binding protein [Methylocystis sp. MJC1]|uniref:AMP-binding protein n=1 Tax=Methylocystis sp. MJC1 TaxID=2654282 RepID=UPI0013EA91CD|nr:AMP-binding protein [Methylocystis sp. MJC1]KAF2990669.1 Long-chain-fatty-acid--CoA ligase [Methylocystis sp. MJC1]MBU6528730.1 AMP-binding protein [Methylocystis sp. MJC1]UZX11618.1 AMP-binding protein [Methylocystis sp. MJC1]
MTSPEQQHDPYAARPWLASYPAGVPATIDPGRSTLVDLLRKSTAAYADRPAMESFGARLSYRELTRAAEAVASWLQRQGLEKGDRVAIMSPNVLAYPAILFGVLLAGGVVVNVNPLYTPVELEFQINDAGARFLFVFENFAHTAQAAWPRMKVERAIIVAPGDLMGLKGFLVNFVSRQIKRAVPAYAIPESLSFTDVLREGGKRPFTPAQVAPEDVAFLQYTGGTTGVAKGAILLHRNVAANVEQTWAWLESYLGPTGPHVMVTALPLYHIFALTACCMLTMRAGGCCLLIANPRDLKGLIATLRKTRFTVFSGVNTLYAALADYPGIAQVDFSTLKMNIAGGMSTQQVVAQKWKAISGKPILEGYGLSETSPILTVNRPDIVEFTGGIGYPLPSTEITLRDEHGDVAPFGERGELWARGPQVTPGYWRRPDETAKAMTPDGFFKTGDVAVMQPDGMFKIVDRLKDIILVSGFNVYPNEVEAALAEHPKVKEVAVIGVPFAHSGEAPMAFVTARDSSLTAEELRRFAHERLTGYKVPRFYEFRESLPKTNVGKILRRALRDEYFARPKAPANEEQA